MTILCIQPDVNSDIVQKFLILSQLIFQLITKSQLQNSGRIVDKTISYKGSSVYSQDSIENTAGSIGREWKST